ncbi:MAG: alkaline phosphatase family protein [Gallionella sp.]|nr:alkaline phosphatase family protein [Gallionella sp.]
MKINLRTIMRYLLTLLLALTLAPAAHAGKLPRPDHVVVVIEENRGYSQIMDKRNSDSYIHALAKRGMLLTQSYGVTHPSQPNYLALFSGSTQGLSSNSCPHDFGGDNLATALNDKGLSFASYSESLPAAGDTSCMSGAYQRKHNPLANWPHLSASANLRFIDFPQDFSRLPTVSFVIPDQRNDMHDGSFGDADEWLKTHIKPYIDWAFRHNSLLILTWDEDNGSEGNRVVTILAGPMVKTGLNDQHVDHYNVLRTLLDFYDLPAMNASLDAAPIKRIWNKR